MIITHNVELVFFVEGHVRPTCGLVGSTREDIWRFMEEYLWNT